MITKDMLPVIAGIFVISFVCLILFTLFFTILAVSEEERNKQFESWTVGEFIDFCVLMFTALLLLLIPLLHNLFFADYVDSYLKRKKEQ